MSFHRHCGKPWCETKTEVRACNRTLAHNHPSPITTLSQSNKIYVETKTTNTLLPFIQVIQDIKHNVMVPPSNSHPSPFSPGKNIMNNQPPTARHRPSTRAPWLHTFRRFFQNLLDLRLALVNEKVSNLCKTKP